MKKFNLTVIACIIALFVLSMIAYQPMATEASNNVSPTATPSPRKRVPVNANVKIKKPKVKGCCNDMDDWVRSPTPTRSKSRKRKH